MDKNLFDVSLIPGLREVLDKHYLGFRRDHQLADAAILDENGTFPDALITRRDYCPLCRHAQSERIYFTRGMNIKRCISCDFVFSAEVFKSDVDRTRYENSAFMESYHHLKVSNIYSKLEFDKASYILSILNNFDKGHKIDMLDIGCSNGQMLLAAKKIGWNAEGIEANIRSAMVSEEKGLKVFKGFFPADMPTPKKFYDVITMLDVLEHIENPVAFLKDVDAYLKKDGYVVVQVPNFKSLAIRLEGASNSNFCHGHWSYFEMETLNKVLDLAGFSLVHCETIISELDKINKFNVEKIRAISAELLGEEKLDLNTLDAEQLHKNFLGYKLLGLYKRTVQ